MKISKKVVAGTGIFVMLIFLFYFMRGLSPTYFRQAGIRMPLSIFTVLIALIDGLNPCTMWVLTFLLVLLSISGSRKRIYAVAISFIAVVCVIYFTFMAAWLNIFKYIGFINPVRIGIALLAIVAGLINMKEMFFFRKGISLMIPVRLVPSVQERVSRMKDVIRYGSLPSLIAASVSLAAFASFVELPCTAGWPIIYTSILASKGFAGYIYYLYLLFYNLVYVVPLTLIVLAFDLIFKGETISKEGMKKIKFIGGFIMFLLGVVLIVNPALVMGG